MTASVRGMGTGVEEATALVSSLVDSHPPRATSCTAPSSSGSQRKEWKKTTTQLTRLLSHGSKSCVIAVCKECVCKCVYLSCSL